MTNCIGKYEGVPIYEIPFKEFYELDDEWKSATERIYLISDDYRVITDGKVFGKVNKDKTRLDTFNSKIDWELSYAKEVAEAKAKALRVDATPTLDWFVKETENVLKEYKHVAENEIADLVHQGETMLQEERKPRKKRS